MSHHRRTRLHSAVSVGLLVTAVLIAPVALPASAGTVVQSGSTEPAACVQARADLDTYRQDVIAPSLEEALAMVQTVEARLGTQAATVASLQQELTTAQVALDAAAAAQTVAEQALADAEAGGDPEQVTAATEALDAAVAAREVADDAVASATAAVSVAEDDLQAVTAERAEILEEVAVRQDLVLGGGLSGPQLEFLLTEARGAGFDPYAVLLRDVVDKCALPDDRGQRTTPTTTTVQEATSRRPPRRGP